MPVARNVWQPISAAMPAALARRRIMHQASDWFMARSDSASALWPRAVRNSQPLRSSGDAGGVDVGAQGLGERVMARHRMLLAAFLVQPHRPSGAARPEILDLHLQ